MHTRLLKCTLEVEHSRLYWRHRVGDEGAEQPNAMAKRAHEQFWFGARSLSRTAILLTNFRARFDAYPAALRCLSAWAEMAPRTQRLICHWHLQLSDPLYRRFAGELLPARFERDAPRITHPLVVQWVSEQGAGRWGAATRIQFSSKLLSSAHAAGLVAAKTDPRPLIRPRVDDMALAYLLYLLRGIRIDGDLLNNAYLASVGLGGVLLEHRLKGLPGLSFRRQGDLIDFGWHYPSLDAWADAQFGVADAAAGAGA
jgi:hypothetical protein